MNIIKHILFAGCFLLVIASCGKEDNSPTIQLGDAPVITAPAGGTTFTLVEAEQDVELPAFAWTAADFGFPAGVTYTLEYSLPGDNFEDPKTLGSTSGLTVGGVTQGELNNSLLAAGVTGGVATTIDVRVTASVGSEVEKLISPVVAVTVIPYESFVVLPKLQVPGSYQGWDVANNSTVIYSFNADNVFDGYAYFNAADTKYKYTLGNSWDVNWGDDGADGSLQPGGADIGVTAAGIYKLHADINALTHTNELTSWGVVGDATPGGWDVDTDMTYDEGAGVLTATLNLNVGKFKFRANDAWTINLGAAGTGLAQDGADIDVAEAGNYTVTLEITGVQKYTYTITKN